MDFDYFFKRHFKASPKNLNFPVSHRKQRDVGQLLLLALHSWAQALFLLKAQHDRKVFDPMHILHEGDGSRSCRILPPAWHGHCALCRRSLQWLTVSGQHCMWYSQGIRGLWAHSRTSSCCEVGRVRRDVIWDAVSVGKQSISLRTVVLAEAQRAEKANLQLKKKWKFSFLFWKYHAGFCKHGMGH